MPRIRLSALTLRRELVFTLAIKLAALLAIKLMLFPARLPADAVAQAMQERLAGQQGLQHTLPERTSDTESK